jgi:hypothetical protein
MPSEKLRRDFAPEQDVIEALDLVPLMKRSRVINEALRAYFDLQQDAHFKQEVLKGIKDIKHLLEQLLKRDRK